MNDINPSISVIIPVHNRPDMVARAIRSVTAQTLHPLEIIVVNDGSNDETAATLDSFASKIRVLYQKQKGVSSARNLGIRAATGDWVAFLDSDDEWKPEKLEKQWTYLKAHPEVQILQTEETWIRNGKRVNAGKKYCKTEENIFEKSLSYCIISPSTIIIKKILLEKMNGFDENLPVCEDYDLWIRIAAQYPIPLLKDSTIYKYGGHADQLSLATPAMDRYRVQSLEKILKEESLTPSQHAALLKVLIQKLTYLRDGALRRGMDGREYEEKIRKMGGSVTGNR